jgi:hypothetical protein
MDLERAVDFADGERQATNGKRRMASEKWRVADTIGRGFSW